MQILEPSSVEVQPKQNKRKHMLAYHIIYHNEIPFIFVFLLAGAATTSFVSSLDSTAIELVLGQSTFVGPCSLRQYLE